MFRVRGDLKRHLKIHLRLIEKEQTQKLKDEAEIAENMVIFNEDCSNLPGYKIKYCKQTNDDTLKSNVVYGDAANHGDIFHETSNLLTEVASTAINNNTENENFISSRKKRSKSNVKPKKSKTQQNMHDNSSTNLLQLPSTNLGNLQNSETLVTSTPVDINKIIPKQEKPEDQYQIYLLS